MFNGEAKQLLQRIADKWDATEGLAKKAENITGDAVGSVMFELRYAGRKLVDAVREAIAEEPSVEKIRDLINEVEQNCHRAHHDAVDSIIWYARSRVKFAEETFGEDLLLVYWNDYIATKTKLDGLGTIVADSREFRGKRFDIYDKMYREDMPVVLNAITTFNHSEAALKALAEKSRAEEDERRRQFDLAVRAQEDAALALQESKKTLKWTIVAVCVTAVGAIAAVLALL